MASRGKQFSSQNVASYIPSAKFCVLCLPFSQVEVEGTYPSFFFAPLRGDAENSLKTNQKGDKLPKPPVFSFEKFFWKCKLSPFWVGYIIVTIFITSFFWLLKLDPNSCENGPPTLDIPCVKTNSCNPSTVIPRRKTPCTWMLLGRLLEVGFFPLFIGFHTSQVVQDFSHQQYKSQT